ncbi:MAG: YlbF family regulator [Clostridiales bacterium]|nr:YlbF family regulator [Clostridiales bacterium]
MSYQSVYTLAEEMKTSSVFQEYQELKKQIEENDTQKALLKEYKSLQMQIQMLALAQQTPSPQEMEKFSALNSLLYANREVSAYLLAEMRLQQAVAEVIKILTQALDLPMDIPEMPNV